MKALEEGRKNREAESVKKAATRPEPSKVKKDTSDDDDLASSYERLFGNRQKKNDTAVSEQKSKPIEKKIKKEEPPKEEKASEKVEPVSESKSKPEKRKETKKPTVKKITKKEEQKIEPSKVQNKKTTSLHSGASKSVNEIPPKKEPKAEVVREPKRDDHVEDEL